MKTRRLVFLALLTAIAVTIFLVEAQIPIPIAGVKLGLANIVTLFAIYLLGPWDALLVLVLRCTLGSIFSGQMMAFLYSITGGLLSWAVMLLMKRLTTERQIFIVSILGSIAHNVGQILVAVLVTGTPALMIYLPVLLISGILAGLFTGLAGQYLVLHLQKLKKTL